MNDTVRVLILAVIQGITEFLPISSDGHLVVGNELLKRWQGQTPSEEPLTLILALHLGTLGSIMVVYLERLRRIVAEMDCGCARRLCWRRFPRPSSGLGSRRRLKSCLNPRSPPDMGFWSPRCCCCCVSGFPWECSRSGVYRGRSV